jgi:protein-S-isoprenylcysteine O-methyltransferase Ste14
MNHFQIAPEQRITQAKFGPEFEAYRQRVRRWVQQPCQLIFPYELMH